MPKRWRRRRPMHENSLGEFSFILRVEEFKRMCAAVLLLEIQFGDGSVGLFCSILEGILDLFASIVCAQMLCVAANYQVSHDRASGVSILMLKKWNCNFLSIAIEEVSKNRLILRSFSMEQVPSSQRSKRTEDVLWI